MTDEKTADQPQSDADTDWLFYMERAARGQLRPKDFELLSELRRHVSPELLR
jgi:hypothetical protein